MVWACVIQNFESPNICQFPLSPLKPIFGRPKHWNCREVHEAVKLVSVLHSRLIRDLAAALGIMAKSTLHYTKCVEDDLVFNPTCSRAIRNALTESQASLRLRLCVEKDEETRILNDFFQAVPLMRSGSMSWRRIYSICCCW